jgi:lipopolysaccharide transport system ATP-binding protein
VSQPDTLRPGEVRVDQVCKSFRLYQRRETTLKEVVLRRRRGVYEELKALDDVSFGIEPGTAVGIIGRNGSGKSTLLKVLARILEPDSGTVNVGGRLSALLELGAGFHPDYTAIENIFLSGALYGMKRADLEKRVDDIIAFAELERFADNPVKTYSSGMFARLGFAIAVNVDPDVLLIDEVLAVGDQSFQARCMDKMMEFRDSGKTLILVTHDLGAVESFCERAIWINDGVLRGDGLPHHVGRRYVAFVNEHDEQRAAARPAPATAKAEEHVPINAEHAMQLVAMSFVDAEGTEREVFHNGESIAVRVHYRALAPVPSPICEISMERNDGTQVTATSSRMGGLDLEWLEPGEGAFEWEIGDLRLTPGTYYFTPRLLERNGMHAFDLHERWYRLRVHAGSYPERNGVTMLPGRWSLRRDVPPGEPPPVYEDEEPADGGSAPEAQPHPVGDTPRP